MMIRRARLNLKPNVRPGGRTVGSGARDVGSQPEEPVQAGEAAAGPEEKFVGGEAPAQRSPDIPEKAAATSSENEPIKPAAAPLQRRKRISTLPNIAKPRVSTSAPVTPSQKPQQVETPPSLPVSSVPCKDEVSPPEKAKVPNSPQGSKSAPHGQHVTLPEKRTPIPQVPQFSPLKKASLKHPELTPVKSVDFIQKEEFTPLKERPSQKSSPNECKRSPPKMLVATGNLEKVRLRRAQKLRELLKDEIKKERKEWKAKHPVISNIGEVERSKMVMRDFIYFIPESNPMKSSFAETKSSEKAPTEPQLSGTPVKSISNDEDDDMDEEEDDSQLLAPRVKVAEDGSIILDEESLTVEVSRGKAPIVEGNDPIFERGSTTTYSSFRKSHYSKPWSEEETDMFYLAISMVGTDFSMIGQLFPHRQRIEIKNKFKREERTNSWRIDKAFKLGVRNPYKAKSLHKAEEKKAFDLVFFSKRLEKALEAAKKKRTAPRVRQPREKKATKPRKKPKAKASSEHVSDEDMALLSDGEGADTRTEEKENEGSVSVKESLSPSDIVPGKKRRNRKKKDTKEPGEEPHKSSPEDTTKLPKKPRKKKAAGQVKDSEVAVNDKNLEDVQEAPDTVREKKKKKSRKKKSAKVVESEDTEVGDIDVPSPQKDAVDDKSTDFPDDGGGDDDDDDDDSLMCIESGELSFTQSEILACAEESSMILFTEDGECFTGTDDLSSLQESLSVMPGSQTVADQYGYFDNVPMETSQEDSVFETSSHLTSDSFKEAPLEEDLAKENHTGTEAEGSTESQKELSRPAALAISRFQRPRPNLPTRALPRQEKVLIPEREDLTEERNDLPADNSSSQSNQKDENLESGESEVSITAFPRNDIPCPVQTNSSLESPQLQPGDSDIVPTKCPAEKEDQKKEKPLPIRGRLVRPKPNLNKAPVKDKPHSADLRSPPKSDSQDSTVPCTAVLTPLSNNEKDTLTKERAEFSTGSQELSTQSTIKPAPLVRGYLQRPKPNTKKKEKYENTEGPEKCDNVSSEDATGVTGSEVSCSLNDAVLKNREEQDMSTHKDTCLDFATVQDSCIPIKGDLSTSLSPVQEIVPEPDPALSSVWESKAESKTSPIKLPQGQLQTLKPNVLKSCDHNGISGMRLKDDTNITPEDTGQDVKGKTDDLSDLGKSTDFRKEASTSDESSGYQENHIKPTEMDQVLPINPKSDVGPKVSEEVQQPAKPTVLPRGRLQRPKPNIVRALPRRGVLTSSDDSRNKSEVESVEKAPESNQPAASCESEKAPILAKAATEDTPSPVEIAHSLETIGLPGADQIENEKSPSVSVDDSASVGMKKEFSGSEDDKKAAPTKPTLTQSRLIRPKPNLGGSVTRTSVSAPQKCDVPEEGKGGKDDVNTSSMENLSQCDVGKKAVLAKTDTEDADSHEEITQSYILPLETIGLPCVDQRDSEESSAVPLDNSSHVTIKNNVSTSEDERIVEPSPGLTRSRLQRPKPNLGRSVTRPVVSTSQNCDVHKERKTTSDSSDTSSIEKTQKQNVNLSQESCPAEIYGLRLGTEEVQGGAIEGIEQSSCTGEQVKEPSVKPLRNRFQKPKPNLGRASVRKESAAFASEQKEVGFDPSSKRPEHLGDKEGSSSVSANDAASGNIVQSTQHTTIKPALLRRGRLVRPVPSYGKPSDKRLSVLQSKTVDEEETSTDTDLETSSNKRKASECFPDVSPKRSCIPDTSQNSSDSALDQVPSTSALPDSSQSNDTLEDNKQQHSRFGRLLKRPVSTTPPVLTKPSENVTERPEKKTSRNNKSVKSTVAKPTSSKGKTTLVKIRAMKEDDDEDDELEYEDEDYDVSPDKMSQAPVFVPFSLRSPKPIPAEIEETLEEFEIPVEDFGVPISTAQNLRSPCLTLQDVSQHVPASQADPDNKGHCDGSTEAAMTLISIGNSAFQSKLGEPLDSDQITGSPLSHNADCKPEASTLSVQMACATEKDTTIDARPVKVCQDTLGLQVGSEALSVSANEHISDPVISDLHTSEQPSHLLNVTFPLEQTSYPVVQDDVQQQDCSTSDHLLEGGSGEETFILTLVEIPISEGYSYSCDGNSADVLPAPVLITSGSSQMVTPDQRAAVVSEPSSSVSCPSGQEEANLEQNPPSRKRGASILSDSDESQPCIKALRTSAEQGEYHTTNTSAAIEENGTSSRLAEIKTEETELPHQSSMDLAVSSPEGEKVPECTIDSTIFDTVAHIENPASTSYDSPSSVLPSSSSSSRIQQRPGRKPLGFLPLVCKGKQSQKTKVTSKKNSLKPKSKKIHENSLSNEVPCQSSSSAATSTPANTETIPCTSQISENLDTISQESPKSQELATEEDAATVSEYFFSDIFMEVDE